MQYRSVSDLNHTIMHNIHKLPSDIEAVIGIPRSGLLAANIMCLSLNIPMADAEGFLNNRMLTTGITRKCKTVAKSPKEMKTVLVIDDSIRTGNSMQMIREQFDKFEGDTKFIYCAVYGVDEEHKEVDIILEVVPEPRMFQWNLMHHENLQHCYVDIDGVLCLDPTTQENDDGPAYTHFLENAAPLLLPTARIGALVTSRLEKYRPNTEQWMKNNNVEYNALHMLDLPSKEERMKLGAHGTFKGNIYKQSDALLFIESELGQAIEIAKISGKPVLCIDNQQMIYPSSLSPKAIKNKALQDYKGYRYPWISMILRNTIGEKNIEALKKCGKKNKHNIVK